MSLPSALFLTGCHRAGLYYLYIQILQDLCIQENNRRQSINFCFSTLLSVFLIYRCLGPSTAEVFKGKDFKI